MVTMPATITRQGRHYRWDTMYKANDPVFRELRAGFQNKDAYRLIRRGNYFHVYVRIHPEDTL
jgi:hypothetical protein